jgi:hypothetical protein
MVSPIKDTPVLYDEDAERPEMAVHNVVPIATNLAISSQFRHSLCCFAANPAILRQQCYFFD